MPSMSRGVINCAKQFLSHPFCRIKWFDQWAVDREPVLTSTTSAKIGKTAIFPQTHYSLSPLLGTLCGDRNLPTWHPVCLRGGRSQTEIGLDRTVEAGRSAFVARHRAQERMSQPWRKTVQRFPNREPGLGQTTEGVSKQACLEWRCRSSSKRRVIPRGHHMIH